MNSFGKKAVASDEWLVARSAVSNLRATNQLLPDSMNPNRPLQKLRGWAEATVISRGGGRGILVWVGRSGSRSRVRCGYSVDGGGRARFFFAID